MREIQFHPLAEIFPQFSDEEEKDLAASIAKHGQQHPIILYQGKILDGRHRYRACKAAGIKPRFEQYKGSDPLGFVVSANIDRRHLTIGQRAVIAARIADLKQGEAGVSAMNQSANLRFGENAPKITHSDAADLLGVSERSVDVASSVLDHAPKSVVKAVESGEMSINAAANAVKAKQAEKKKVVDALGKEIPAALHSHWDKNPQVQAMLRSLAGFANDIKERHKAGDIFFGRQGFHDALANLEKAHQRIKAEQLHCVCPYCQGRQPQKCSVCKGLGLLSKFIYDSAVPEEIKRMASK